MPDRKDRIRVAQYGLGAIGVETARLVQAKDSLELVGAVEIDPAKHREVRLGVPIFSGLEDLVRHRSPDVVLHTTGSRMKVIFPQLAEIAGAGIPCVSSAEELFHPVGPNLALAAKLNKIAASKGIAIAATGVNPGFVMDLLPALLTATCRSIRRINIRRIVDVSKRRIQLQRKVGVGMSHAEFIRLYKQGKMGHVGLRESAAFVADAVRLKLSQTTESLTPAVSRGRVNGIHQIVRGMSGAREVLTLELEMIAGATNPRDEIKIDGDPSIHVVISGGVNGDPATAAILVNSIPLVLQARPGLRSALEPSMPRFTP